MPQLYRILVTHLTRMGEDRVCIAGSTDGGRHIRPVLRSGHWTRSQVRETGLSIGCEIEFHGTPRPVRPELEDVVVEPPLRVFPRVPDAELGTRLNEICVASLRSIFGDALDKSGTQSACTERDCGTASLGIARLTIEGLRFTDERVRLTVHDHDLGRLELAVTDLRLHPTEPETRRARLRVVGRRLNETPLLAVGLGRAFARDDEDVEHHWLQVNNLHFVDHFDDHPVLRSAWVT